jgi:uncharacterized membrane protein YqjE
MTTSEHSRPLTSVLTQIVSDVTHLLQTEIRLARAEINEKVSRVATNGKLLAVGAVLSLVGLLVAALAIVAWLAVAGMPEEWGLTLVGAVLLIAGVALAIKGSKGLSVPALKPQRTLDQLHADVSTVKEQVL